MRNRHWRGERYARRGHWKAERLQWKMLTRAVIEKEAENPEGRAFNILNSFLNPVFPASSRFEIT